MASGSRPFRWTRGQFGSWWPMFASRFCALALLFSLASCVAPMDSEEFEGPGSASLALEGAREGYAVLRLLNDTEGTTFSFLDDDVALNRRSASNLIAHRDGADGESGTGDDNLFDSIAEVDAVRWVGPAALLQLAEFARLNDYLPGDSEILGEFDGVAFTYLQAESVLTFVNDASEEELRSASVPARSIGPIFEARPVLTMTELAGVYWVGPRTLEHLRDSVSEPAGGEACQANDECQSGFRCVGKPTGFPYGKCRFAHSLEGASEDCTVDADCLEALVCVGFETFGAGYCSPAWMRESYVVDFVASLSAVVMSEPTAFPVTVFGQASVPMDITVDLNLEHSSPQSLWIGLQPPTGQEAVTLWDGRTMTGAVPSTIRDYAVERDNAINGEWALLIQNLDGSGEGTLRGYTLHVSSRWD